MTHLYLNHPKSVRPDISHLWAPLARQSPIQPLRLGASNPMWNMKDSDQPMKVIYIYTHKYNIYIYCLIRVVYILHVMHKHTYAHMLVTLV